MSQVYVVLLNWNGAADTIECVDSLLGLSDFDFRVVVCDNGSTDGSLARLSEFLDKRMAKRWSLVRRKQFPENSFPQLDESLVVIDNEANLGFAGGNNVGVQFALRDPECRFVWLLNNDTIVDEGALAAVAARMEEDESIGICGSTLVYHHDRTKVQALGGAVYSRISGRARHIGAFMNPASAPERPAAVESQMSYVIGAAMFVRREYFEQIGLMDDGYFLYFEEIDWARRGRSKFRLGYAPKSVVYHKEGASIGTSSSGGSPLSIYFLFRNRVLFTARFFPFFLPTVISCCFYDVLKFVLKRRWSLVAAALKGLFFRPAPILAGRGSS